MCGFTGLIRTHPISNDDVAPVLALLSDSIKLSFVDSFGFSRFSFFKLLFDASEDSEALVNSELGLLGDISVSLSVKRSSLRVTCEGPVNASIFNHTNGEFSGVGTISTKRDVLGTNIDVVSNEPLDSRNMKSWWAAKDLNICWIELHVVEHFSWEGIDERLSSITFPVSTYKIFSSDG